MHVQPGSKVNVKVKYYAKCLVQCLTHAGGTTNGAMSALTLTQSRNVLWDLELLHWYQVQKEQIKILLEKKKKVHKDVLERQINLTWIF